MEEKYDENTSKNSEKDLLEQSGENRESRREFMKKNLQCAAFVAGAMALVYITEAKAFACCSDSPHSDIPQEDVLHIDKPRLDHFDHIDHLNECYNDHTEYTNIAYENVPHIDVSYTDNPHVDHSDHVDYLDYVDHCDDCTHVDHDNHIDCGCPVHTDI